MDLQIEEIIYTGQVASNLPTDICISVGVLYCQEVGFGYVLWWTTRTLIVDLDYGTIFKNINVKGKE